MSVDRLVCHPIGIVRSPFLERVQAPRQASTARDARGRIELFDGQHFDHAIEDLDSWNFIWILFWFHLNAGWRPKVLPPRSERRRGVFATRSPHRPNPIGMSVVKLEGVAGLTLHVSGIDMLDGTPVLDIKPYVPYADAVDGEAGGWLEGRDSGERFGVEYAPAARQALDYLSTRWGVELEDALERVLEVGPAPHPYRRIKRTEEGFLLALKEWRAHFEVDHKTVRITRIESGYRARDLSDSHDRTLDLHRDFSRRVFE